MPSKRRLSVGPRRIEEDVEVEEVEANDDEAELQAMVQEREEQVRRKSLGITSPTAIRPGRKYASRVCVCVCVYLYTFVCVYVCMCMYVCVCVYVCMYIYVCMYECMCVCVYVHDASCT